jgi:hypothetical protein
MAAIDAYEKGRDIQSPAPSYAPFETGSILEVLAEAGELNQAGQSSTRIA